jgi:Regulator of Vps4 activity in the MVB pathway
MHSILLSSINAYLVPVWQVLELFCELLAVRATLVEKTKDMPPDMVEAISSLIYAAPRVPVQPIRLPCPFICLCVCLSSSTLHHMSWCNSTVRPSTCRSVCLSSSTRCMSRCCPITSPVRPLCPSVILSVCLLVCLDAMADACGGCVLFCLSGWLAVSISLAILC